MVSEKHWYLCYKGRQQLSKVTKALSRTGSKPQKLETC